MQGLSAWVVRILGCRSGMKVARVLLMLLVLTGSTGLVKGQAAGDLGPAEAVIPVAHKPPTFRQLDKYSLYHIGNRGIGRGIDSYSLQQERLAGAELVKELDWRVLWLTDATVNNYVNSIVQRISRNSDAKVQITVKVAIDDDVNAYNLPGGFIYVNSGLILAADDEASLAAMIAHEIAHVAARHGAMLLAESKRPGDSASLIDFHLAIEREADMLALQYLYAAGYDPTAFGRFLKKVRDYNLITVTPDHPSLDERILRARLEIATTLPPKSEYVVNTSEFDAIKMRLRKLTTRGKAH